MASIEEMAYAGKESMMCDYEPLEAIIRKSLSYTMKDVMDYAYGKNLWRDILGRAC